MFGNFLLVLVALVIDGFQVLIEAAFAGFLGTIIGAAGGAAACARFGETAATVCASVGGVFGTAANVIASPAGIVIGLVIGCVVSLTLGTGLVFLLSMSGMFYPRYILPAYLGEVTPGLGLFPAWTTCVVLSIMRKKAETAGGSVLAKGATLATGLLAPASTLGKMTSAVTQRRAETSNVAQRARMFTPEQQASRNQEDKRRVAGDIKEIEGTRRPTTGEAPTEQPAGA